MKVTNSTNYSKKRSAGVSATSKFFIVIPCYKPDISLFTDCLSSIKATKYPNYEVLVVLDGDFSNKNMVKQLITSAGEQFKYLNLPVNVGTYQARLEGYKKVSETINAEDYIINVDCDDTVNKNIFRILNKSTRDIIKYGYNDKLPIFRTEWNRAVKDKDFPITTWTTAYKGSYIKKNLKYINDLPQFIYGEDTYFIYELGEFNPTYKVIRKSLYNYKINESSVCNTLDDINKRLVYIETFLNFVKRLNLRRVYEQKGFMYYKICEFLSMQQYVLEHDKSSSITKNLFYGTRFNNFRSEVASKLSFRDWVNML